MKKKFMVLVFMASVGIRAQTGLSDGDYFHSFKK